MNSIHVTRKTVFSFIITTLLVLPAFAQAQDAIGRIIRTTGIVNGVNAAGDERPLARGSNVYMGETIATGPSGNVQMRLTDGAMITLNEDSVFIVNDFQYDGEGGADDTVIMTMTRGTMRTITGVIGDATGDTYEMNTPFASIGVRGTEYGVVVDNTGRMRVVVFDGSITATTAGSGGFTVLGLEGDADAAEVLDPDAAIIPLTELPADLQAVVNTVIDVVTEQQVNNLPDDSIAVEVQINQNQQQRQQQQEQNNENNPGNEDAAGAFVDALGQVVQATTEEETSNAQATVIITVSQEVPGAFDISVSPN